MNACTICHRPVLELEGQFENLEPYYAEETHVAAALVGECHSSCISDSPHGNTWFEWRVRGYSRSRGYRVAMEQDGWTVLVHSRHPEFLAFHVDGFSVSGERRSKHGTEKAVAGGILVLVDEEFNLALTDAALVDTLKARLKSEGRFPIAEMLELLGVADRVKWPFALEGGAFMLDRKLQRDWTNTAVAMRARYARFLPEVVAGFWRGL